MEKSHNVLNKENAARMSDEDRSKLGRIIDRCAEDGATGPIMRCIEELLEAPGFINLDMEDIMTVLSGAERVVLGDGYGEGPERTKQAAANALKSEFMPNSLKDFTGVLIRITTGPDTTIMEMVRAADVVREAVEPDVNIIWGHVIDDGLDGKIRVSLIAAKKD